MKRSWLFLICFNVCLSPWATIMAEEPESRPLKPCFQSIQANILIPHCTRCHEGASPSGDVDLSCYASVLQTGGVIPGNPERSNLYLQVFSGAMPQKKPPLSAEQLNALREWIQAGALNN